MDALLWELLSEGSPNDEVEVLIKLSDIADAIFEKVSVIAQLGNIATCHIKRGDIETIYGSDAVMSMKANRLLYLDPHIDDAKDRLLAFDEDFEPARPMIETSRPASLTGKGVIIGLADWGIDFTHPNFLLPDGTTRFKCIWNQDTDYDGRNIYKLGRIYSRKEINKALQSEYPFETLNYHPGKSDVYESGMHGTHVLDIASGNGNAGGRGVAPGSELIAVHLSSDKRGDVLQLGSSVTVFNALHFLDNAAGLQPLVINMSVGSHGDAHAGLTLVEQAIDFLVTSKSGRAVVQSCGNYFASRIHTEGILNNGQETSIGWIISAKDVTPNQIEIWYEHDDGIAVSLISPSGIELFNRVGVGRSKIRLPGGEETGGYYHRKDEPNTGLNQVLIILNEQAEFGKWNLVLFGEKIKTGYFKAWIERDNGNFDNQSRFPLDQSISLTTTGSICNGFHTICTGAYTNEDERDGVAYFSSAGPTWDGRIKPDLLAPGLRILAAKSASPYQSRSKGELTYKSGTSMAAPYATGAVALIFEAAPSLIADEIRNTLLKACILPRNLQTLDSFRAGAGLLNIEKLLSQFQPNEDTELFQKNTLKKTLIMENDTDLQEQEPSLSIGAEYSVRSPQEVLHYFDRLPSLKSQLKTEFLKQGDVLLQRHYGHHHKFSFIKVHYIHNNIIFGISKGQPKQVDLDKQGWELKLLPREQSDISPENIESEFGIENRDIFSEDFKIRGNLRGNLVTEWMVNKAAKDRVYYVTSGGNGVWKSPVIFNFKSTFYGPERASTAGWAIALRLMGQGQPNTVVPLEKQKGEYLKIDDVKVINKNQSASSQIRVSFQDINKAYSQVNLDDPQVQLEAQLYWSERDSGVKFFYDKIFCNFYLVNPLEFIDLRQIVFEKHIFDGKGNITHAVIKLNGKTKKIKYPAYLNDIKNGLGSYSIQASVSISISEAHTDIKTDQVVLTYSRGESDSTSTKVSMKGSEKTSFSVGEDVAKAGSETAVEIGAEFQTTKAISKDFTKSYLNSKTVQDSFSIQKSYTFQIPKTKSAQLFIKPIFRPLSVKIIRFESIDSNGMALKRTEDPKPSIIWVNYDYYFYMVTN